MTDQMEALKKEFEFYLAHQDELAKAYNGKIIVIKDGAVLGAYDSDLEAIAETTEKGHELGTFLVQLCSPNPNTYRQTFHSRAALYDLSA